MGSGSGLDCTICVRAMAVKMKTPNGWRAWRHPTNSDASERNPFSVLDLARWGQAHGSGSHLRETEGNSAGQRGRREGARSKGWESFWTGERSRLLNRRGEWKRKGDWEVGSGCNEGSGQFNRPCCQDATLLPHVPAAGGEVSRYICSLPGALVTRQRAFWLR